MGAFQPQRPCQAILVLRTAAVVEYGKAISCLTGMFAYNEICQVVTYMHIHLDSILFVISSGPATKILCSVCTKREFLANRLFCCCCHSSALCCFVKNEHLTPSTEINEVVFLAENIY